jgi:hypothetical protein
MNINPEIFTVPQLREQIKAANGGIPAPSKLRKNELVQYLEDILHNQAKEESLREEAELGDFNTWRNAPFDGVYPENPTTVSAAALSTETNGDGGTGNVPASEYHPLHAKNLTAASAAASRLGTALETISDTTRKAAQALTTVAWRGYTAVVRSMGQPVRGKVVATELRTPDSDGSGRVLLVVQHNGHPHRRTLHRLVDVKFEPLTS